MDTLIVAFPACPEEELTLDNMKPIWQVKTIATLLPYSWNQSMFKLTSEKLNCPHSVTASGTVVQGGRGTGGGHS